MTQGTSIAGRKVFDSADFYRTPMWATEALLKKEKFTDWIWEPACGDGAISKVLVDEGYHVWSSDLYDRGYGIGGVDFLGCDLKDAPTTAPTIITNPPYNLAQQFIEKALELSTDKVAMLLKLQFLEGAKRVDFFKSTPLRSVYVFSKRVTMYPANGEKPKNSGTIAYAWYVWEHGYTGKPTIDWL